MIKSEIQALDTYYVLMDLAMRLYKSSVISASEYRLIEQKAADEAHLRASSIYREKWRELLDFTGV